MELETLKDMLDANWDSLVEDLFPNAQRHGGHYAVGSIDGEKGDSLVLWRGHRAGSWKDYAGDDSMKGDALRLIERVCVGATTSSRESFKDAIAWAKNWLGVSDELSPGQMQRMRAEAKRARAAREKKAVEENTRIKNRAKAIWLQGQPSIKDTPADAYLQNRGIDLSRLGRQPAAIRYNPECYEADTRQNWPAMVSSIIDQSGFIGVHRTYLARGREGRWDKINNAKARKVYGRLQGGFIPIWRGKSGKPIKSAPEGETVIITEGIEDAFALAIADPSYRVLAAVSLSNLAQVWLPPQIGTVILAEDNDWDNPEAQKAFRQAIATHGQMGRTVKLLQTPPEMGKDANDWLRMLQQQEAGEVCA